MSGGVRRGLTGASALLSGLKEALRGMMSSPLPKVFCFVALLLLLEIQAPVALASDSRGQRPAATVRVCSDYAAPSDRDLSPILVFVEPSYLFVLRTVSSVTWPYLLLRYCSSSDFGTTWDGSGASWGTGSKVNQTIAMVSPSYFALHVYEEWLTGEVLNGPWGPPPTWARNATNPSVAYSFTNPRFAAMAFRVNPPTGSVVMFTHSEDYTNNYRNWTEPFDIAGAGGFLGPEPSTMPAIATDASDRVHLAYLRADPSGRRDVYYLRNDDRGREGAWATEPGLRLSSTSVDSHDVAIATSREGQTVLVLWTATEASGDEDVAYAYSRDAGTTWRTSLTLSATGDNEGFPVIAVDPVTSTFHVAWWRDDSVPGRTNNVLYAQASGGDPGNWTTPQSVADPGAVVSSMFRRPAIASGWRGGTNIVNVAWTDARNGDEDLYMTDLDPIVDCSATASPTSGTAPLSVAFGAAASGGIPPYTYVWRFGDGATSMSSSPAHTFTGPGVYGTALQVRDVVGNLCYDTVQIDVLSPLPDLAVRSSDVTASAPPHLEASPLWVNATVRNLGGGSASNVAVRLALGSPSGPSLGDQSVPSIPSLGNASVSFPWTPPAAGAYTVCVVADPDNGTVEVDEGNNAACVPLDVLARPDPAFLGGDVTASPATVPVGGVVDFTAVLRNLGGSPTGDLLVALFRDANGDRFPDAGEAFDTQTVASLAGGATASLASTWTADLDGTQSLCAYADPDDAISEGNETNNVDCASVTVSGPPDYVPWRPLPPSPVTVGLSRILNFSVEVRNEGDSDANATARLVFYNASTPSNPFASFDIPPVGAGGTAGPFVARWVSPGTPGAHAVRAVVDAGDGIAEGDESNNEHTWTISVVPGPVTTLVVGVPNATAGGTYVTSATPLSLTVLDPSGTGIRSTRYQIDGTGWVDYAGPFSLSTEGPHLVEWYSEDNAGNVEAVQSALLRVDDTPPSTALAVGDPKHVAADTFVTWSTPLSLAAADGGATPVGLAVTEVRIDGSPWSPYAAPFTLVGEGPRTLAFRSRDLLGNEEPTRFVTLIVDDSPPDVTLEVGTPRYTGADTYVTSATGFAVTATDGGAVPVGLAAVEYRLGGPWTPYAGPFTLAGPDGPKTVEARATDLLGHVATEPLAVVLDDTPPVTMPSHGDGTYPRGTAFAFPATDAGSGLARTEVRVDAGAWTTYATPLVLAEGDHTIGFRSVDRLNNTEADPTLSVAIAEAPVVPPETNWKPLVAGIFVVILALVGAWSSRHVPWATGSRRNLRAFAFTALPFVALEGATGVLSLLTGLLSIPPLLGAGTAVDVGLLLTGIAASAYRVRKWMPPK